MDFELIATIAVSAIAFAGVAFCLLRFTSAPGLRPWPFAAIVLLSYPVVIAFGYTWLFLRLPLPHGLDPAYRTALAVTMIVCPPVCVWTVLRAAVAVRRRPTRIWWLTGPAVAALLTWAYLRHTGVPLRTLDYQSWRSAHPTWAQRGASCEEANGWWLRVRAYVDYMVSDRYGQSLRFHDFWCDEPDHVYLRFMVDYDALIIYCYSRKDRRLLWKAWWPISDA